MTLKEIVERAEKAAVISALESNAAKMNQTAAQLGITRKNLWEKMRKYAITKNTDWSYAVSDKPDYVEDAEEKVQDLTADERIVYDGKSVAQIAKKIRTYWQTNKDMKKTMSENNKKFDQLSKYLAERMDTSQLSGFKVNGVGTVFIGNDNKPYVNDKETFFADLRATGNAGLIKETVHPMALLGLVNELVKDNKPLPPGVHNFVLRRAKIRSR